MTSPASTTPTIHVPRRLVFNDDLRAATFCVLLALWLSDTLHFSPWWFALFVLLLL